MGFVALKPLKGILPSHLAEGQVPILTDDRVTATRHMGGLEVRADSGTGWALSLRESNDGTMWEHASLLILDTVTAFEVERLNRVLKGTGFPKVETDWRSKKVCVLTPGRRLQVPVRATFDLDGEVNVKRLNVAPLVTGSPIPRTSPTAAVARAATTPVPAHHVVPSPAHTPVKATPMAPPPMVDAPWDRPQPVLPVVAPVSTTPQPLKAERLAPTSDPTGVFTWPTESSNIVTAPGTMEDLDKVWAMHLAGDRQTVALIGPAGTGKTSLAYDLAVKHKVPVAKVDAAGAVTFADWVGFQSATEQNGATVTAWSPSGFMQAIRADGPMAGQPRIVIVDEVNRAESSGALNALIPVLDHTGSLYVADALRSIPIDQTVMVVMTANIGGAYTGTVSMDAALEDRVTHWVEMLFPAEQVEVDLVVSRTGIDEASARRLVKAATQVRAIAERGEIGKGIGPRKVLQAAAKVKAGFTLLTAAKSTWVLSYSGEGGTTSERATVRSAVEAALA